MLPPVLVGCLMGSSGADPVLVGPDIYASATPSGNGSAIGSPCSLTQAVSKARAWVAANGPGAIVHLLDTGGVFRLTTTLVLDGRDSGVTYQAETGHEPRISGGVVVTGWSVWSGDVYRADLPAGLAAPYPQELVVGGRRAIRSRGAFQPAGWSKVSGGFTAPDSTIAGYAHPGNGTIVGRNGWRCFRVGVASASGTDVVVRASDWAASQAPVGVPHLDNVEWVEGYRELVANGEGYFAIDADGIYYRPRPGEDMGTIEVVLPILEALVLVDDDLQTPCDLAFDGVTFSDCTWALPYKTVAQDATADGFSGLQSVLYGLAPYKRIPGAITVRGVVGVTFDRCVVERVAQVGIAFERGAQDCSVTGTIFDCGSSAFSIGSALDATEDPHPSDPDQELTGITIANCAAVDCAWLYESSDGLGVIHYASNCTIAHNVCEYPRWGALSIGWGWGLSDTGGTGFPTTVPAWGSDSVNGPNAVENNAIFGALFVANEGGAIYANGAQAASTFDANYIEDCGFYGFYLDNGCETADLNGNAFFSIANHVVRCQTVAIIASNNTIDDCLINKRSGGVDTLSTGDASNVAAGTVSGTEWTTAGFAVVAASGLESAYLDVRAPNVARIETAAAFASSYETSGAHLPARVIDGYGASYWQSAAADTAAWIVVDLGIPHDVTEIIIEPRRGSTTASHRSEFVVEVAESYDGPWTELHDQGSTIVWPGSLVHVTGVTGSYRYVRVAKTTTEVLAISTIRVFGLPTDATLIWGIEWSDLPVGNFSQFNPSSISASNGGCGGGLVFGTTANPVVIQTGPSTAAEIPASNAGISEVDGQRGLSCWPASTFVTGYRDMSSPPTPGVGVTYTPAATTSPLGGSDTSYRVQVTSGGFSDYGGSGLGGTQTLQFWVRSNGAPNALNVNRYNGVISQTLTLTPGTSWERVRSVWTTATAPLLMMSDGRAGDGGVPAAGARDHFIDFVSVTQGVDYGPWCSTSRTANQTYFPGAQWITRAGRMKLELDVIIGMGSADMSGAWRLWTDRDDATTYVEITTGRVVNVSVGGSVVALPTAIPAWSANVSWILRVDVGNGAPSGSVEIDGTPTDLGTGGGSHASIAPIEIDVGSNGASNVIPGARRALRAYV